MHVWMLPCWLQPREGADPSSHLVAPEGTFLKLILVEILVIGPRCRFHRYFSGIPRARNYRSKPSLCWLPFIKSQIIDLIYLVHASSSLSACPIQLLSVRTAAQLDSFHQGRCKLAGQSQNSSFFTRPPQCLAGSALQRCQGVAEEAETEAAACKASACWLCSCC